MKQFFGILIALFFVTSALQAQEYGDYGNEWISHEQNYWKFKVGRDGLHRIPYQVLVDAGIPIIEEDLQLFRNGKQVPIYLKSDGDFGAGDYIEFIGERNDGEFDTQMYEQDWWQVSDRVSLYTDTAAYFLTLGASSQALRYTETENDLSDAPEAETHFRHTRYEVMNNAFFAGRPIRTLGGVNSNFADFEEGEGFAGEVIKADFGEPDSLSYLVQVGSIYEDGEPARANIKVLGRSNDLLAIPDHHIQFSLNGTIYVEDTFENYRTKRYDFEFPVDQLESPYTSFQLAALCDVSSTDKVSMAYIYLNYPHSYDFSNKRNYLFEIEETGESRYLEISNFNGGTAPVIYDITNQLRLEPINEDGVFKVVLPPGTGESRKLYISETTSVLSLTQIEEMEQVQFIDFTQPSLEANYLIITHPSLREGPIDNVQAYREYRESEDGGSFTVLDVDIDQLYDQFAWGTVGHPLSIKNFVNFAIDNWDLQPDLLFLIGKSISYDQTRNNPFVFPLSLVPTYGYHPSDCMLTTREVGSYKQQLGTGRYPARTPEDVATYLAKVIEYENYDASPCTKEGRLWMKHAMHIAGAEDSDQREQYLEYLEGYKNQYEDTLVGGKVIATYSKATIDPVEIAELDDVINAGLGVINFFGHSSGQYWSVNIESPENYENEGKYPFIMSNSCFVGDIHNEPEDNTPVMAEDFLKSSKGAIGFLATVAFGFPDYLDIYCSAFYDQFCKDLYSMPIGMCMKQTIDNTYTTLSDGIRITSQDFTLAGDPGVRLTSWDNPEFIIEDADVFTEPAVISAQLDSFLVNVIVTNVGKAVKDSFTINVTRTIPGTTQTYSKSERFPVTTYIDTLGVYMPNDVTNGLGNNDLTITVDYDNDYYEDCEDNNSVDKSIYIFSELLIPISPCNFAIVGNPDVTLSASTGTPISGMEEFIIQIDTTEMFNSPLLKQSYISQLGGVLQWKPGIDMTNNTVYYWRTTIVPEDGADYPWQYSSFVYQSDSEGGWNQSHYYQFKKDDYSALSLDSITRQFTFPSYENTVRVVNAYVNDELEGFSYTNIRSYLNLENIARGSCMVGCGGGVIIGAFDPNYIMEPIPSLATNWLSDTDYCQQFGQYGQVHCFSVEDKEVFEFPTETAEGMDLALDFMNNVIPDGYFVLMYSIQDHHFDNADLQPQVDQFYEFFADCGGEEMPAIENGEAFIFFGRKGGLGYDAQFEITEDPSEVIELEVIAETQSDRGTVSTPPIGPSQEWKTLFWAGDIDAGQDVVNVDVYGINALGEESLLFNTGESTSFTLTDNYDDYRYLRLKLNVQDSVATTPAMLDYWKVFYTAYPELSLDQNEYYEWYADTLREGELGRFGMAITNTMDVDMDSVMVRFTIFDEDNNATVLGSPMYPPLAAGETAQIDYEFDTAGLLGENFLLVEVNPDFEQPEKYIFNNVLIKSFFVIGDEVNPLLDVTFDGLHILDGDIVSAEPEIVINLRDENTFLALNDTSNFSMAIANPLGEEEQIYFASEQVTFVPADDAAASSGNNVARVIINKGFTESGIYELLVRATDRSGNESGNYDYRISFEVITENMVSNVLNYPNPFTSSTKFIFTLTGSQVPEDMKIQIMTVSGKVVREIFKEELGPLHIGRNITEFAWDGTDQYGNELGNGVYFYRVSARNAGEDLELFANKSTQKMDELFNKYGIGKMYLMR